jgi:hypothetical protein
MKQIKRKLLVAKRLWITALLGSFLLVGCGGGDGGGGTTQTAGIGGTGIVAGKITGFGSVYVNGSKYNTSSSEFIVDGILNPTQDDLAIGMVVLLKAESVDGVYTGNALQVAYDDEIQGPVAAAPIDVADSGGSKKSFSVFGQTILIDQTNTVFDNTSFASLDANDVIEVSGFRSSPTLVDASYVKKIGVLVPGISEVELRGTISSLMIQSFKIEDTVIRFNNMTEIDTPNGELLAGLFVEVGGIYQADQSILAEEIEEEDEGFGNNVDEISLQGVIAQFADISNFFINGQRIDASQASLSPSNAQSLLEDGLNIEVDGDIVNGVLIADELEIREGDSKLRAFVGTVIDPVNNSFEVDYPGGSVNVRTNGQTLFEDETGSGPFSINDLQALDFVRIEGQEVNGEIIAGIVKRTSGDDSRLEGAVDFHDDNVSITILGITYSVDTGTSFKGFADSAEFFQVLVDGDIVEIQDDQVADGIADDVELDD